MSHHLTARTIALVSTVVAALITLPAAADDTPCTEPSSNDDAKTLPWSLGMEAGIAWRAPRQPTSAQLFMPPARPTFTVYAVRDLGNCSSSILCVTTGGGAELDGLIPTRSLLDGAAGQPGVQTTMFTSAFFNPWMARIKVKAWFNFLVSARWGISVSTLQYSSNADGKVFSETSRYWLLSAGAGVLLNLSSRTELLLLGAYRPGAWQQAKLRLTDDSATLPSDHDPFVTVDRRGFVTTIGLAYRP